MSRPCQHCSRGKIRVNSEPIYSTPYEDMSTQERIRLATIQRNFWTEPLNPAISITQQRMAQQRVVQTLSPWYMDNGGSTRSATVNNFFK